MTGGIIEFTIPWDLWENINPEPIQLPKGTYKALIENPSKVLYIHVVENLEGIKYNINTLQAIRVIDTDVEGIDIIYIEFLTVGNEFAIMPDDTITYL